MATSVPSIGSPEKKNRKPSMAPSGCVAAPESNPTELIMIPLNPPAMAKPNLTIHQ